MTDGIDVTREGAVMTARLRAAGEEERDHQPDV
jgi:hypothetical protein